MNSTTTTGFGLAPEKFRKTSVCPHCGAPIYADAKLTEGENGEVLTVLPMPYYTCMCRFSLQPHVVPYVVPVPAWPAEPTNPNPPPSIPGTGNPIYPTWGGSGDNINVHDDGHRTICRSPFEIGSGGASLDPELAKRITCFN